MYTVWRRDDGYVSASNSKQEFKRKGFSTLLLTDDWSEARDLIEEERAKPEHITLVKRWDAEA